MRAAERARAKRFVYFSAIGASLHQRSRFFRAKALAERAVEGSELASDDVRAVDRLLARTTRG